MKKLPLFFSQILKSRKINFTLITFLGLLTVNGQIVENPYDPDGWSILDPANASKILYVSTSGDNDTGEVYSNTATEIGSNPILPSGAIRAFRTIGAAMQNVSNGDAAWILLKRGDVFYQRIGNYKKNGESFTRPIVFASYGSSNEPPLLKTGSNAGISGCCRDTRHIWFIGLSFYAHTRNPNDPEYVDHQGEDGFNFYTARNHTIENLLIEGCTFNFYRSNVIQTIKGGTIENIRVRRNVIRNNYGTLNNNNGKVVHSQGLFSSNIKGGILVEENIFDHNGWFSKAGTSDPNYRKATIFNHNTYFYHTENAIFRRNAFHRPSSTGTKWANTDTGDAVNITLENNLYNDCEVGISMGGNDHIQPHRFKDITIKENVMTSIGLSQQTDRTLGWGIDVNDWDGGDVMKNLIIHQNNPLVDNVRGISVTGENRNLTISKNIIYNLGTGDMFRISALVNNTNVSITDNEITQSESRTGGFMVNMVDDDHRSIMSNNTFELQDDTANTFNVDGLRYSLNSWMTQTGATNTITPAYPDPSRSFDRYVTEVLGLSGRDEYYQNLEGMNYLNWDTAYTAAPINAWIKEGFDNSSLLSTMADKVNSSIIKMYPNPGTGMIKIESSIEGNYRIYNQLGQIILSEKFKHFNEIDLEKQKAGLYMIHFYNRPDNIIKTIKYLKK